MVERFFFPKGIAAILSYCFLALPFLIVIERAISGEWLTIFLMFLLSYLIYALSLNRFVFRLIWIKDGLIGATGGYTPINRMQHPCKVLLKDIKIADFGFAQGNSKGKTITRSWDIPFLRLTLFDGSIERIMLCGYSKKQIKEIESSLIQANENIVINRRSEEITDKH